MNEFKWEYSSVGGVVRVVLKSGEAIAHLGELDQKKWTVLSAPVNDINLDSATLALIDKDADGKIRVAEIVATADYLCKVLKNKDLILEANDVLSLDQINTDCPEGQLLYNSAKTILADLGKEASEISLADTADSIKIFSGTVLNGDGVVIPESAGDNAAAAQAITDCIASVGSVADRSGAAGIDTALLDRFYTALADYKAWVDAGKANEAVVCRFGDDSAKVIDLAARLDAKVSDFFIRCKLIAFDANSAAAVDVAAAKIAAIADRHLDECAADIAECPIAHPTADAVLPYNAINPAWKADFDAFKALVLDKEYAGAESVTEAQWQKVIADVNAVAAYCAAKKGAEVEALGIERITKLLDGKEKEDIIALIAADEALRSEAESIAQVDSLLRLKRDFFPLLKNYVVFSDFYGRHDKVKGAFEVGKLYIDERCCDLCLKVQGTGNHAEAAGLSGMFLIYCTCTSKTLGKTMNIVAVMTDGSTRNLRAGKNAIFYDNDGNDWDAVVTKVVDNPISIKQAFFAPYVKFWNFCVDKINKSASEKDAKVMSDMQASVADAKLADAPDAEKKVAAFDIAKFAGIFAAIGMAIGFIGQALVSLATGIKALSWWQLLLAVLAIMLLISGPSCFIAWTKLRKRNLGPVLNANGWAINSVVLVNILFGKTLTSVAKYPVVRGKDPFAARKTPAVVKWLIALLVAAAAGTAYWWFCCRSVEEPVIEEVVEIVEIAPEEGEAAQADAEAAESSENE